MSTGDLSCFVGAGRGGAQTPSSTGQQQQQQQQRRRQRQQQQQDRRGFGGFTPSSRGGFSLADMLDGRAMGEGRGADLYSSAYLTRLREA